MRQLLTIIIVICLTIHVTGISYALRPRAAIQSEKVELESAMHDKTVELYGIEIKIPEGYYIIHETDKGADILNSKDNFDEQYRYLRGRIVKAKERGQIPLLVTSFHHPSLPFAKAIRDIYGIELQILSSDHHHDIYLPDEEAQELSKFDRGTVWRYGIREGIINASDLIIALSMLKGNHYITYEALMELFSKEEVKEALERIPIESFDSLQRLKQDQNYSSIPYLSQINRLLHVNYFEADVMDLAEMLFAVKTGIVISPKVITAELLGEDTAILFSADSDAHLTAEDWKGMGDILVQHSIAGVHICESPATEELFNPSALSDFLKRISVHHTKTSSAGAEIYKNEVLDAIENTFGTRYYHFEKACDELLDVLSNPGDYAMTWLPPALQTCRKLKSSFEQIIKHAESSDTEKAKILHIITSASLNDSEMFALLEKLIPIIGNLILDFKNNGELGLAGIRALKVAIREESKTAIKKAEELMYFFENIFKDTHQETDLRMVAFSIILSCVQDDSEIAVKCLQNLSGALEELVRDPNADTSFKERIISELSNRYSKEQKYIEHILEKLMPYLTKLALTLEIPKKLRNECGLTLRKLLVNKNAVAIKAVEEKLQAIESIIVNPKLSNYDKADYIDGLLINMALNGNKAAIPILKKLLPMIRNLVVSLSEKKEFERHDFLGILLKMSFLKIRPARKAIKDIFTNDQVPIGVKEDVLESLKIKVGEGDQFAIYAVEQLIPIFEKLATDPQVAKISDGFVKTLEYMGTKGNEDAFLAIDRLLPDLEHFVTDSQKGRYEKGNFFSAIVWCASKSKLAQASLKRLTPYLETCVTDFGSQRGFNSHILDVLNAESKSGNPAAIQLTRELLVVLHEALSDKNIVTLNELYIREIVHFLTYLSWKKIDPSGNLVKQFISVVVDIASNEECSKNLREDAARSLLELATELKEADAAKGLVDLLALDKIERRGFLMNFLHQKMMEGNITAYLLLKSAFMGRGGKEVLPKERTSGEIAAVVLDREQGHASSVASIFKENMGEDKELEIVINTDRNAKFEDEVEKIIQKNQGKIIVINMSLGTHALFRRDSGKVGGILDVDRVEKWGEQGVIFVIAAGNDNFLSDYSHRVLDNVIMVGAAEKVGLNYEKADYSSYGLDIFCLTSGNLGLEKGTSLTSPRIAGLLVRILRENPNLSIPDALEKIRQFAKPIENSILFKLGMLGVGVIIPEEVDNKKITQITNNTRTVKSSDELHNQHSTTTAIKSSA